MGASVGMVLGAGLVGLPTLAPALLGVGMLLYAALVCRDLTSRAFARSVYGPLGPPLKPEVEMDDLTDAPSDIRAMYYGILRRHEDLRVELGSAGEVTAQGLRELYARCTDLVQTAGHVAHGSGALARYLDAHSARSLEAQAEHLDRRGGMTRDAQAARAFERAASARRQQLAAYREIEGFSDRIHARLALVEAFLGGVEALAVKFRTLDAEEALSAESLSQALEDVKSDLEILEASFDGLHTDEPAVLAELVEPNQAPAGPGANAAA